MSPVSIVEFPKKTAEKADVSFLTAVVLCENKGKTFIRPADGRVMRAARARGCLVKPEPGDLVLAVDARAEGVFVLDVLAGAEKETRLSVKGDLAVEADGGSVTLSGRRVSLSPSEAATVEAPFVGINGAEGRLRFHRLSLASRFLAVSARRAQAACDRVVMTAGTVFQRMKNLFRRVEELEETRAGRISVKTGAGVHVRGGRFSVVSDEEVRIDGKGIHIG